MQEGEEKGRHKERRRESKAEIEVRIWDEWEEKGGQVGVGEEARASRRGRRREGKNEWEEDKTGKG